MKTKAFLATIAGGLLLQASISYAAPLHRAVREGNTQRVQELIRAGDPLNAQDRDGYTSLMIAALKGHAAIVRMLLDAGAQVNAQHQDGRTALQIAALEDHAAIVRLLLDAGAQVDAQHQDGSTALHFAACKGHGAAVVRLLIDAGAQVDARNRIGLTALHQAASWGHTAIVQILLHAGAQVDARGGDSEIALHRAAWKGHTAVVRLLLDAGAQVDARDRIGSTALSLAVRGRWILTANAARELVKAGATLTPQVKQILIEQGETEFLAELRKLAVQRLEALLTFLERAPERLPDDIADLLLQFESSTAQRLQQLRAIRTQQRQAAQQP